MFDVSVADPASRDWPAEWSDEWSDEWPEDWPEGLILELTVAAAAEPVVDEPLGVPAGLDQWLPGPLLGVVLSTIDVDSVSESDRVTVLKAWEKMISHSQARSYEAMTAISDAYTNMVDDPAVAEAGAAAEIRAALRWTRRTADFELGVAHDLRARLPRVFQALREGRLDRRRAMVFLRHTDHLSVALARETTESLVDEAHRWTSGQLSERLRRACIDADPDDAHHRYTSAIQQRRVSTDPTPDGTVTLTGINLPAHRTAEALDRINRIARQLKTSAETRSMDQLRADVLLDLLCGHTHGPVSGSVHITVDLTTLTQLDQHPGDLAGYGPVIADIARHTSRHLQSAPWTYTVTHPNTGLPLTGGTTRRRPTTHQQQQVRNRHRTCIFPGCRMPSIQSDLDHRQPWAETHHTRTEDLAPLCRHDHCIRHQTGWTYTPTPTGDTTWTSPLGHTYTTSGHDP